MEKEEKQNGDKPDLSAAIETILFVYGEPLSADKIAKVLTSGKEFGKLSKDDVEKALREMKVQFSGSGRGLTLIFGGREEAQLATKSEFSPMLENFIKDEFKESLSPASLETLGLIAYLGPLSRARIDFYRGVNSSFILRSLMIRGLINRSPDPERANAYLYQPSFDLLKYLGLTSVEELPEYEKFKSMAAGNNQESASAGAGEAGSGL